MTYLVATEDPYPEQEHSSPEREHSVLDDMEGRRRMPSPDVFGAAAVTKSKGGKGKEASMFCYGTGELTMSFRNLTPM